MASSGFAYMVFTYIMVSTGDAGLVSYWFSLIGVIPGLGGHIFRNRLVLKNFL